MLDTIHAVSRLGNSVLTKFTSPEYRLVLFPHDLVDVVAQYVVGDQLLFQYTSQATLVSLDIFWRLQSLSIGRRPTNWTHACIQLVLEGFLVPGDVPPEAALGVGI